LVTRSAGAFYLYGLASLIGGCSSNSVTDYLDGVLAPELKDKFQTHLAGCDGCVEYVRQIGLTIGALQEADLQATSRPRASASSDPDLSDR
jgi:anti-sigma factor RsiW